jgi:serine protease inhibitor
MRKNKILLILSLILIASGCVDNNGIIGTYYLDGDSARILTLYDNGNFYMKQANEITGTYERHGNELILTGPLGIAQKLQIIKGSFIDTDGMTWKKKT